MPRFTYAGTLPRTYPETRDEQGVIVGLVVPGEVLDLAEPLDEDWRAEDDAAPPAPVTTPVPPPPPPVPAAATTPLAGTEEG